MSSTLTYDVYVANIPLHYTESQIKDLFNVAGEISSIKLLPPKSSECNNVAFVRFVDEEDAICTAKYMKNHVLADGTILTIRYKSQAQKTENMHSNGTFSKSISHSNDGAHGKQSNGVSLREAFQGVGEEVVKMSKVFVIHIESPIMFWGQNMGSTDVKNLQNITEQMELLCPNQSKVVGQLSTQQIYGCKFSEDNLWYRCRVEKCMIKNLAKVRYIDYGNSEVIERFGLVNLPLSLATQPELATCYCLDGLELVDADDNTTELNSKGLKSLSDAITDKAIEMKVMRTEGRVSYCKVMQVDDGQLLDLPRTLIASGAATTKTVSTENSNGLSLSKKHILRGRTPFSALVDGIKKTNGVTSMPPAAAVYSDAEVSFELKTSSSLPHVADSNVSAELQECKSKMDRYEKDNAKKDSEISSLKKQLEQKRSECDQGLTVSSRFNALLSKVTTLRDVRKTIPAGGDVFGSDLQKSVDLCLNNEDIVNLDALKPYQHVLASQSDLETQLVSISECTEKNELDELIETRNKIMRKCIRDMKSFLKHAAILPADARYHELIDALEELKTNYTTTDNSVGDDTDTDRSVLEKYVSDYESVKKEKSSAIKSVQQTTNTISQNVFRALGQLQRECHCVVSDATGSVDDNLDTFIMEYGEAINEEIKGVKKLQEDVASRSALQNVVVSLILVIQKEIHDIVKIRDNLIPMYEARKVKYGQLLEHKPDATSVLHIRQQIKSLKSKFRHKQADISDLEEESDDQEELEELHENLREIRTSLHKHLLNEQDEMKTLSGFCKDFPELKMQYPELGLDAFLASSCLRQNSRLFEHYGDCTVLGSQRKQTTYKCVFNSRSCVVKEIILDNKNLDFRSVSDRVIKYAKQARGEEIKISTIFTDKKERKLYLHQNYADHGNLKEFLEKESPCKNIIENILKDVLKILSEKTSSYSSLKPQNVLIYKIDGKYKALLGEPNFIDNEEKQLHSCLYMHKIIPGYPVLDMYQEQPSHQADMICFGGLLLWALHQSSTFSKNIHSDVEMIVEEYDMKDILRKILNPSPVERITAMDALEHECFKKIVYQEEEKSEKKFFQTIDYLDEVEEFAVDADEGEESVNENEVLKDDDEKQPCVEEQCTKGQSEGEEEIGEQEGLNKLIAKKKISSQRKITVAISSSDDDEEEEDEIDEQEAWNKAIVQKKKVSERKAIVVAISSEEKNDKKARLDEESDELDF